MNADLKRLIRLQTIDLEIQQLRATVEKFPGISKALDEKLRDAQANLAAAQEKSKNSQANRKKFEGEVATLPSRRTSSSVAVTMRPTVLRPEGT